MADNLYTAAEKRALEARRAGLQARKDEQPLNTARSYALRQREWKVRAPVSPSPAPFLRYASLLTCMPRTGAIRRAWRRTALCTAGRTASW
jgi:hypothetical protein